MLVPKNYETQYKHFLLDHMCPVTPEELDSGRYLLIQKNNFNQDTKFSSYDDVIEVEDEIMTESNDGNWRSVCVFDRTRNEEMIISMKVTLTHESEA